MCSRIYFNIFAAIKKESHVSSIENYTENLANLIPMLRPLSKVDKKKSLEKNRNLHADVGMSLRQLRDRRRSRRKKKEEKEGEKVQWN